MRTLKHGWSYFQRAIVLPPVKNSGFDESVNYLCLLNMLSASGVLYRNNMCV